MKKFTLIYFILAIAIQLSANNNPRLLNEHAINNEHIVFNLMDDFNLTNLEIVNHQKETNYIEIEAVSSLSTVQVLRENGEIDFQLPVNNKKLVISLDDFAPGVYKINLLFEDSKSIDSAQIIIK